MKVIIKEANWFSCILRIFKTALTYCDYMKFLWRRWTTSLHTRQGATLTWIQGLMSGCRFTAYWMPHLLALWNFWSEEPKEQAEGALGIMLCEFTEPSGLFAAGCFVVIIQYFKPICASSSSSVHVRTLWQCSSTMQPFTYAIFLNTWWCWSCDSA